MRPASILLRSIVAFALPPRCPACGVPVGEAHRFCGDCWGRLHFLAPPWCATCHRPSSHADGPPQCDRCLADPPRHAGIRAAVAYGAEARTLALGLKYGRRLGLAETMARQMVRLMPADAAVMVPVPLHRRRIWGRGFNQAMVVAARLRALTGVPVASDALVRRRATPVLRALGPAARRRAVAGAFAVRDPAAVADRAVILVDDVYTSGATADGCVAALLDAGAASVTLLCWARVLPADD